MSGSDFVFGDGIDAAPLPFRRSGRIPAEPYLPFKCFQYKTIIPAQSDKSQGFGDRVPEFGNAVFFLLREAQR